MWDTVVATVGRAGVAALKSNTTDPRQGSIQDNKATNSVNYNFTLLVLKKEQYKSRGSRGTWLIETKYCLNLLLFLKNIFIVSRERSKSDYTVVYVHLCTDNTISFALKCWNQTGTFQEAHFRRFSV